MAGVEFGPGVKFDAGTEASDRLALAELSRDRHHGLDEAAGSESARAMKVLSREVESLRAGSAPGLLQKVSVLDLEPKHAYVPVLLFFKRAFEVEALRASLRRVLVHFPEIAGRLVLHQGEVHIASQDQGVRFEEVLREGELPTYGPAQNAQRDFRKFLSRKGFAKAGRDQPLLDVCVTRFEGGGAVLGVALCHTLADGTALFAFLSAWAAELRGESYPRPTQSRSRVEALGEASGHVPETHPRYTVLSRVAFAKFVARFLWVGRRLEHAIVRFDAERLAEMKRAANEELAQQERGWVSTNDVLGAHLWSTYLKLGSEFGVSPSSSDETLTLIQSMRSLLDPPFEPHFLGNCATNTSVQESRAGLQASPVAEIALKIRRAYAENDAARIRHLLIFLCEQRRRGTLGRTIFNDVPGLFAKHTLMLNDWSKFPIYELDFGSGRPFWFELPAPPLPRFMLLAPAPELGARDVHIVLERELMQPFLSALR